MSLKKFIFNSKMFEYDKHYRDCTQSNQPFIKAKTNPVTGHYHVQIDLLPCHYALTDKGMTELKKLFEKETEHLSKTIKNTSYETNYSITKELSWVDGVLPSRLNAFCETLYEFTQKHHD